MWAPLVAQSISRWYSISCHVRCSTALSMLAMAL